MSLTESSRNELHNKLTQSIGPQAAETLMAMLPPVGWADVATERDLDQFEAVMNARFDQMVTHRDLRQLTFTVLAINLTLVLAVLGAAGLS